MSLEQKYTDALVMLERTSWPGVDLDSPNAEQVIHALTEYAYAKLEEDIRQDAYKSITRKTHPVPRERADEQVRLYTFVVECERKCREKLGELRELVGQEEEDEDWMEAFRSQYNSLLE